MSSGNDDVQLRPDTAEIRISPVGGKSCQLLLFLFHCIQLLFVVSTFSLSLSLSLSLSHTHTHTHTHTHSLCIAAVIGFERTEYTVNEGAGTVTLFVRLMEGRLTDDVEIDFVTEDGTATSSGM